MKKAIFTLLILLLSLQFAIAQDKPKAELVDEFPATNCCNFEAKLQTLFEDIKDSHNSKVIFVTYTNLKIQKQIGMLLYFRRLFLGQIDLLNFDENRVSIKNFKTDSEFKMQFWVVPNEAEISINSDENSFELFSLFTKPKVFFSTDSDQECTTDGVKDFAKTLNSDSNLYGNIVIFNYKKKNFISQQKEIIKTFVEKYRIPRNCLRFFYRKSDYPNVEFWLVPKKSRN